MNTPEPTPISERRMTIPAQAHEVWQTYDGSWTYWVLKKYQTPEREMKNPWARWYCAVISPATFGRFSYGDTYVAEIVSSCHQLSYNPLNQDEPDPDGAA